jgi:hypothetical protein
VRRREHRKNNSGNKTCGRKIILDERKISSNVRRKGFQMNNSIIVQLCGEKINVEYSYNHRASRRFACELVRVADLLEPEKHLRDETIDVIKAQIHFYEKCEKDTLKISVINELK